MTKRILCAALAATFYAAPSLAADNVKQQTQSGDAQAKVPALAVVLVPVAVAGKQHLGDCWARLYTDENFAGDQLSLVGPVDMPNMRTPFGRDWSGEFESIAVGPKATVTVYDNEDYAERAATFKAGQRVPKLDEKLGFFEQVRSVKIACAGGGKTAKAKGAPGSQAKSKAAAGGGKGE